ncbi:MAG TPA: HAMP domain-containing sensor histidine kinase, partial [Candidatus Angelobacter sp.]|nr:HAMP domain-containing sensor histidine kinase [Candidatus Angelobacter sp.]
LLRNYLIGQVDHQLARSGRFTDGALPPAPGSEPGGGRSLPSPFVVSLLTASGQLAAQVRGSEAVSAPAPDLAGLTVADVRSTGGRPFDVGGLGDSGYHYRALAVPLADGSGSVVVAISTQSIDATVQEAALAALAVGAVTLGLVGLLTGVVIRLGLRPLEEVERTAERIAAGDLGERVPDMPEGTEIGRLATSLNGMLGQIESAFDERRASEDRLRRFVADASHELRTPLTSIRGYAELSRTGAIPDEESRRAAIARIEAEAVRMGVLVDDLLLLARLDQQRPLERRPVDLVELVDAAADGLRASAPDRTVTVTAPDGLVVAGDAARLRQVVDNLLANARVHTAAGSPVEVVAATDGEGAVLTVRDRGPGMSTDDVAHATERFYRGDPSRTRQRGGGSGLGLSIVQAIVAAHGGRLEVRSSREAGTAVTVHLPEVLPTTAAGLLSARA